MVEIGDDVFYFLVDENDVVVMFVIKSCKIVY